MSNFHQARFDHPGYIAGRSYCLWPGFPNQAAAVAAVDVIYFHPFRIFKPVTFTAGWARVVTGGAASSAKSGIWDNSTVSMRPLGAPLFKDDTGVATATSATTVVLALGAGTLGPGFYWAGMKFTGTLPVMYNIGANDQTTNYLMGTAGAVTNVGLAFADAYANAMPTLAEGASFTSPTVVPLMGLST